ncbi:MAG: valine--tRNA ligase [Bacteroidales bacterium]|nr:valine--tRNA ligase [Bacteroidales bacterium]
MEMLSKYVPSAVEDKWYRHWMEKGYFHSEPDARKPYTIVLPPPNVTGVLHMGHMLNSTIQDILVRRARMKGLNACWVPGMDHASIATEAKVVAKLKEEGISKQDISREEFMKHAWEWKEKHGGIILEQLKKLGTSCDWQRTRFTMDESLYQSVIKVFVDLYNKGLIYRGVRMVNWDPVALTAVSDEEVVYKEAHSKLYYLRYYLENENNYIVVATTRPETILGDTAVCVHPEDERFLHLKGKKVVVPLVGRVVPLIRDEYVDREFGTGALKITPAHDINDYRIGLKHHLESIDIFNDNGTLNKQGLAYAGMDRFVCRKRIVKDLEEAGLMEKIEDYTNKIGHSERTDSVIEPKLSTQWFLKMEDLAAKALEVVEKDDIRFHPVKFKNIYRRWLENIRDWCISRQLWWGQRIPAYYLPNGEMVVAETREQAYAIAKEKFGEAAGSMEEMRQDEDVLDTWFSSWLWPISVFDGIRHPDNKELAYYYPTDDLVTAPDIIFFWVARMIMAGEEYRKEIPFKNVYFTGLVRDKLGRKMSKSLGNSPDPIALMEQYGADGVRMGMLLTAPAGNDLPFDTAICEQGRNFCNKIWNALRLVKGWTPDATIAAPAHSRIAAEWMGHRFNQVLAEVDDDFTKYRLSEALMSVYKLIWDDFCSTYLEIVKPAFGQPIDAETHEATLRMMDRLMQLLHPFMPFLTEEVWHMLRDREEDIMVSSMPQAAPYEEAMLQRFAVTMEMVEQLRRIRAEKNISPKEAVALYVKNTDKAFFFEEIVCKLCNLSELSLTDAKVEKSVSFVLHNVECFVPFSANINVEEEKAKIEADIAYMERFLDSVLKKLSNEQFVSHAPEKVVALERKKQADAEEKLRILREQLEQL